MDITTNYQEVDAYFLIDKTCSMGGEMSEMRTALVTVIDDLTCDTFGACLEDADCGGNQVCGLAGVCIDDPQVYGCVPSFWTGTGVYGGSTVGYCAGHHDQTLAAHSHRYVESEQLNGGGFGGYVGGFDRAGG